MKLKLLVDKKSGKVLFAEANKDFVDFLFSFMSLPLGAFVKLVKEDSMIGSLGVLFGSIESLKTTNYFQSLENMKLILDPNIAGISAAASRGGFVKGVVTYMVMNNLEVKPLMSTISSIDLINCFNIGDISCLEEMIVDVGPTQALKLMRASNLESKKVLTSVFMDKKEAN